MQPLLEQVLAHAVPIALRTGGLMTFAPFFGNAAVTARVKVALTVFLTYLLYPICRVSPMPLTITSCARISLEEAIVGLLMGLAVQVVFEGVQIAGQVAGMQLGFSLASIIDPQTNIDTPVLAVFQNVIALLIFLELNVHHWIIRGLVKSFDYLPAGHLEINSSAATQFVRALGAMWLIGVQIAAPVLLATMAVDMTLALTSKAAPQMPALLMGMSLKGIVGYTVMAAAVGLWPGLLERLFAQGLGWSERLLHMAR